MCATAGFCLASLHPGSMAHDDTHKMMAYQQSGLGAWGTAGGVLAWVRARADRGVPNPPVSHAVTVSLHTGRVAARLHMAAANPSREQVFTDIHGEVSTRIALLKRQEEEVGRIRVRKERELQRVAQIDASRQ